VMMSRGQVEWELGSYGIGLKCWWDGWGEIEIT